VFLQNSGIDASTLREQIAAQIAWGQYIQRKIVPKLQVSDSELERNIDQYMQKQRRVEEVLVATIDIPNLNIISKQFGEDDAGGLAAKLTEQLRSGVDFGTLAKQLSATSPESATTPTWVQVAQMPPPLAEAVRAANVPAFLDPFQTVNGYQIIFVQEKRLSDYQMNAELLFKEIILHLEDNATKQDVDLLMNIAGNVRKHSGSCTKLDVAGATDLAGLDFEVKYMRANLSEISPQIFPLVRGLQVGETSEPFATPDGIRLLKLCEKTEKPIEQKLGKELKDRISGQLRQEKLQLEAVRALRELRRHAFIDVRG
jgi:peptidyl-prolyl cis-trans isomerase SurA